jgi:hypothetical protein
MRLQARSGSRFSRLGLFQRGAVLGRVKAEPPAGAGGSRGGTRRERYQNALGSARETVACLDVAEALGYVGRLDAGVRDRLDFICGTLVKNVR